MRSSPKATGARMAAIAVVAVSASLAGSAHAATTGGGSTITVCVQHKGGGLYRAKRCARRDSKLSWNARGPQGLAGAPGLQGGTGAVGAQGPVGPSTGAAGGALSGSYPSPTLNVTGGACADGQALTDVSSLAALTCGPGVYSDAALNLAVSPTPFPALTSGTANSALGEATLSADSSGSFNSALGIKALQSNSTGFGNSAVGQSALARNVQGSANAALGVDALFGNTTGADNTAVGENALLGNTGGNNNTALGPEAGKNLTTGSNNVDISATGLAAESNTIRIGGVQTAAFLAGVSGVSISGPDSTVLVNGSGQLGTATSSLSWEKMDLAPLSSLAPLVLRLRPVSYRYRPRYAAGVNPTQYGLIAQEVQRILPALVQRGGHGQPTGVYYQELPVLLVALAQQQQRQLAAQQREIAAQRSEIGVLRGQQSQVSRLARQVAALQRQMRR